MCEAQSFYILRESVWFKAIFLGLGNVDLRRKEELAEAAVEERDTGLRYMSV